MRVACVQMTSGIHREANIEAAVAMIRMAAADGAELIATPEMTTVLDRRPRRLFEHLPTADDLAEADTFAALATELNVVLLIGSMGVALDKTPAHRRMANRSFLFTPGGGRVTYDKLHLFDVELPTGETWRESATMQAGEEAVVACTDRGAIGLSICYDVRFPHLYRALAQSGAEILAVPAAFTKPTGEAHWHALLRARAIETGSFVIAPAQGGQHEDERVTYGHSLIIDPWGRILAEKADDTPGVISADIDLELVRDTRARIPSLGLDRPVKTRTYKV